MPSVRSKRGPVHSLAKLAQAQEPGGACCEARGGRRRNERRQRLNSARSIVPKPSRRFIQDLRARQYRLGQEHSQIRHGTRMQHLASLNRASRRMAARSRTSGPSPPSLIVGIAFSPVATLFKSHGREASSNVAGSLQSTIRNVTAAPQFG
jgi:hypothetical protein